MNCYYCTREVPTVWLPGTILGFLPIGHNVTALVLPKDQAKIVPVEITYLEIGDEDPTKRAEKLAAEQLKAQQEAEAKQAAEYAKVAAKARIKAEALAKAEAEADAAAEAEAAKEVAKLAKPAHAVAAHK